MTWTKKLPLDIGGIVCNNWIRRVAGYHEKSPRLERKPNMNTPTLHITTPLSCGSVCRKPSGFLFGFSSRRPYDKRVVLYLRHRQRVLRLSWRILFQIVAMQLQDYKLAKSDEERNLWKTRILETLQRMNKRARMFKNASLPLGVPPPTAEYLALSVTGNWCLQLTEELTSLFTSA